MIRRDFLRSLAAMVAIPLAKLEQYADAIEHPKRIPDGIAGLERFPWLPCETNGNGLGPHLFPFSVRTEAQKVILPDSGVKLSVPLPKRIVASVYGVTFNHERESNNQYCGFALYRKYGETPLIYFQALPRGGFSCRAGLGSWLAFQNQINMAFQATDQFIIDGYLVASFMSTEAGDCF